jgi:hypothetical protein
VLFLLALPALVSGRNAVAGAAGSPARGASILIEAETLRRYVDSHGKRLKRNERAGGYWVLEPQFVDQVGSAYLMAHGLGTPVKDVSGKFKASEAGSYRVLVHTKDWYAPHKLGRFQVLIDGKPLKAEFGSEGKGEWVWQSGGRVKLTAGEHTLALHDLTGLHGRCDCILLTTDEKLVPPTGGARQQQAWRRNLRGWPEPAEAGPYDLVVVGGGSSGKAAAYAAARLGLKTALIDNMDGLGGKTGYRPREGLNKAKQWNVRYLPLWSVMMDAEKWYRGNRKGLPVSVFNNTHVYDVVMDGRRIASALAVHTRTGRQTKFTAPLFVDATGDGNLGVLAGAKFMYGQEGRDAFGEPAAPKKGSKEVMGSNVLVYWGNPNEKQQKKPVPDFSKMDPYPKDFWRRRTAAWQVFSNAWLNESGYFLKRPEQDERVRDLVFVRYYSAQTYYTKHPELGSVGRKVKAGARLLGMDWFLAKRESRRLVGDVVVREQDYWAVKGTGRRVGQGWYAGAKPHPEARQFEDGVVTTCWHMDVHVSRKAKGRRDRLAQELLFLAGGQLRDKKNVDPPIGQCHIPFRALYARDVENMFMAGRCISATRLGIGAPRTTNTTARMGVAVGRAAAVCRRSSCTPREAYEKHLAELKKTWALPAGARAAGR